MESIEQLRNFREGPPVRQPEGQIDENFGQDHLHRVIVTTGLDNIEALDPRSVFPGGSRKFLQFPIFPKVGPKLGEQRRTQVSTSASSGDLQPPLGEELRAPSGARPACCPPLQLAVLRSLGERRDQVPGEPPAVLGDHAYHQVPLFSQLRCPGSLDTSSGLLLNASLSRRPSSTTWKVALQCSRWLCLPLYLIQQGFGDFSLGNRHLLSGLSCCLQLVH